MPSITGREMEFNQIIRFLHDRWTGTHMKSLFIYGSSGQGKTNTLSNITNEDILNFENNKVLSTKKRSSGVKQIEIHTLHSASMSRSNILHALVSFLKPQSKRKAQLNDISNQGYSRNIEKVFSVLHRGMFLPTTPASAQRKLHVIVFDEVDLLPNSVKVKELLACLIDANKLQIHYAYYSLVIILVSNSRVMPIESDQIIELPFLPYTTEQLKHITNALHLGMTSHNVQYSPTAVNFMVKKSPFGDVRTLKNMHQAVISHVSKHSRDDSDTNTVRPRDITVGDVARVQTLHTSQSGVNSLATVLNSLLTPDQLLILCCCIQLAHEKANSRQCVTVQQLYAKWSSLQTHLGLALQPRSTLMEHLTSLQDYQLVAPTKQNRVLLVVNTAEAKHALYLQCYKDKTMNIAWDLLQMTNTTEM